MREHWSVESTQCRGWAVVIVMLFALAGLADFGLAQTGFMQIGSLKRSPADIVKRYVRLDQKGARLDAMGFDVLGPYVEWKEEPVWDRIVVIQGADVAEDSQKWDIIDNLDVFIPVTFRVRGFVDLATGTFTPDERTEEVRFHVKEVRYGWRIVEPVIPPHITVSRMVNFVREAGLQEKDDTRRGVLASLVSSLRKAK